MAPGTTPATQPHPRSLGLLRSQPKGRETWLPFGHFPPVFGFGSSGFAVTELCAGVTSACGNDCVRLLLSQHTMVHTGHRPMGLWPDGFELPARLSSLRTTGSFFEKAVGPIPVQWERLTFSPNSFLWRLNHRRLGDVKQERALSQLRGQRPALISLGDVPGRPALLARGLRGEFPPRLASPRPALLAAGRPWLWPRRSSLCPTATPPPLLSARMSLCPASVRTPTAAATPRPAGQGQSSRVGVLNLITSRKPLPCKVTLTGSRH